ncbi:MAG: HD-GYP domain-containing protein [Phycisphaerae bacterium]|nr:HD-GYP domain-containing protein [Phycisphaerae bacterium]
MSERASSSGVTSGGRVMDPARALDSLAQLDSVAGVMQRLGAVIEENEGLANEVLRSYEQLNLVFEFTQKIAHITDVAEIERILIERTRTLLDAQAVEIIAPDGIRRACRAAGAGQRLQQAYGELPETIERVRQSRQVAVATLEDQHVIAGPLVRLDNVVDVVVVIRRPGAPDYTSGDVLMLDSVLSFGGQIITNCEMHRKLGRMSFEVTRALVAAIDQKDHYTSGHSERVGRLARLTGVELGLQPAEVQMLEWAGLLHDVGKIGIPEEILNKPGKLTDEEFAIIRKHPRMGYDILKPIASFEGVLSAVLHHHENIDGSGYPDGQTGDETPVAAKIIHVVDVFDALTSARSYRAAFSVEKACAILRSEAGTKMDAQIVAAFCRALEKARLAGPEDSPMTFTTSENAHANRT